MVTSSSLYRAQEFYLKNDYVKAFEVIEEMFSAQGNDDSEANILQDNIFKNLAEETENLDLKITYLLSYVECYSRNASSLVYSAEPLVKAKERLSFYADFPIWKDEKGKTEYRIKLAESRIADFKTLIGFAEQDVTESKKHEKNKLGMVEPDLFQRMRSYWKDLDVESRRNFMKVRTADLIYYIKDLFDQQREDGQEPQEALGRALTYAKKNEK